MPPYTVLGIMATYARHRRERHQNRQMGGAYFQTIRRMWHRVKVIVQCNVIIKNGRVIDGSGAPSFNSKVGIRGGILVEVDKLNSEATQVINV